LHVEGAHITAPPFSEETIIMLNTGWSYPELLETPGDIVDEISLINSVKSAYQTAKAQSEKDK
jgi:hypothetical protein